LQGMILLVSADPCIPQQHDILPKLNDTSNKSEASIKIGFRETELHSSSVILRDDLGFSETTVYRRPAYLTANALTIPTMPPPRVASPVMPPVAPDGSDCSNQAAQQWL